MREILPAAKFFNADQAAHALVELPEVKQEIREKFGGGVFSSDGALIRAKLRTIIFGDATRKRALERILHPRIRRQWRAEAKKHRNFPDFFFADIPLLYETGGETLCDRVVVVACSYEVQVGRLMERMSLEASEAKQMIKSQMPLEEKIRRADHVAWNNGDRAGLMEQARFLAGLWQQQTWTKS
jgi:dephospho-CoA kinase